MKLEKFVGDFDGAPLALEDFAEGAVDVEDCLELSSAAYKFIMAQQQFEEVLSNYVEIG